MLASRAMRILRGAILAIGLASMALASPAFADERAAASKKFEDGERAYRAGDFTLAGDLFEDAYALSPHADALWNAARAWHRAGERARAANLYARFLREAPPNAPDRNRATTALIELSRQLGKLELQKSTFDAAKVDDRAVDAELVYVAPGGHEVVLEHGDERDAQSIVVGAGAVVSVAFREAAVAKPPPPPPPPEEHRGWSPTIVWIGAGLTAVAAGFSIWSGVDTLNTRDDYLRSGSKSDFDDGRAEQRRTNIGWVVTGSLAALTAATALVLVDWKSSKTGARTRLTAGPGSLEWTGKF
jgi:tetratricopeptide (TPR) repeat protein